MTTIETLFGSELPIIQSPMAGAQGSALTIEVCNAGGLGSLGCALLDPGQLRAELERIRAGTDRPFNLNFFCHNPPSPDAERDARWREALAPYFAELGADAEGISTEPMFPPFGSEVMDVIEAFQPPVVSFHFGLPSKDLLARVRRWGARVICSATTVSEARWLEARGVDAVIAQGVEAGGHRGIFRNDDLTTQLDTFVLLPQILRAVSVPVIAAGGIADANDVSRALALGAAGVQAGTAYLFCPEATITPLHRVALESDAAADTALTNVFTGRPARAIVNRAVRELGPLSEHAPAFPLALNAMVPLRTAAEAKGQSDFSSHWCGARARSCRAMPARELTLRLAKGVKRRTSER